MKQWLKRHLERWITKHWYYPYPTWLAILLLPLAGLMYVVVKCRFGIYRLGWLPSYHSSLPVIVVGNIGVGGSGKTPLVIALVNYWQNRGYQVGVVSRGYGGQRFRQPHLVKHNDHPRRVGDEPLMIKRQTNCWVCVSPDRPANIRCLESKGCDVIISDDGLQHYAMGRDIEVGMIDGARQLGNLLLLPAGPLRETESRLQQLDYQVETVSKALVNDTRTPNKAITMLLRPKKLVPLDSRQAPMEPQALNILPVHAVTAIGNPQRFFASLTMLGYRVIEHAYPDHAWLTKEQLQFDDEYPIIMTAKDAIKCEKIAGINEYYLEVEPELSQDLFTQINRRLSL